MALLKKLTLLAGLSMLGIGASGAEASTNTPVYFVHGFDALPSLGYDCGAMWSPLINYMTLGSPWNATAWIAGTGNSHVHTVGYYTGDSNCSDYLGAKADGTDTAGVSTGLTPIDTIAKRLANLIYNETNFGTTPVSVVAHSMGGLIVRRAIDGVNDGTSGYPPTLNIKNVVNYSSPHGGYTGCNASINQQCKDMNPTSSFFTTLLGANGSNPQSAYGTQWTLMGSTNDGIVTYQSATDMPNVYQRIIYDSSHAPTHSGLTTGWLNDDDNAAANGTPVQRYADVYSANASIPSTLPTPTPAYDHWMKVATARIIQ